MAEATRITPEPVVQPPEKIVLELSTFEARNLYHLIVDVGATHSDDSIYEVFTALRSVL